MELLLATLPDGFEVLLQNVALLRMAGKWGNGGDRRQQPTDHHTIGAAVGGSGEFATFLSARLGVRAHIQHLKAYGNEAPLAQKIVDPRFRYVRRGVAPPVERLSGRLSADLNYGEKILAIHS